MTFQPKVTFVATSTASLGCL